MATPLLDTPRETQPAASQTGRPVKGWFRVTRFQFSLRMLLVALTAFAIGFPIWYRWPYEAVDRETPPGSSPVVQEMATWQRQWGGGRLKHGEEKLIVDGRTVMTTMYRNGHRHGPRRGENFAGQFVDGMKEGIWTDNSRWFKRTSTWHRDQLEGPSTIEYPDGKSLSLEFTAGRLTQFNGKPARNRLFDLMESETDAMDVMTREELQKVTEFEVVEMPLKDVVEYLQDAHGLPIHLDTRHLRDTERPISADCNGVDLCSALTLLTAPFDLACDYRYGTIWITTAADAEDWADPTGVAGLKPRAGSALARAWNEPSMNVIVPDQQLADLVARVSKPLGIVIDTTLIEPTDAN